MSKLGIHLISWNNSTQILDFIARAQPAIVKMLDFNTNDVDVARGSSPGTLFVGRQYVDSQPLDNPPANARNFFNQLLPAIYKMGNRIDVWEGYNEVTIDSPDTAQRYNDFTVAWADIMHAQGLRCAAYSFSTGNPDPTYWPMLAGGAAACDYLALHEYDAPRMDTHAGQLCLRYRLAYASLPSNARRPILITECGIDDGQNQGWVKYASPDDYVSQLAWYDSNLMLDNYVVAASIFTIDSKDWRFFEILPILPKIAAYIVAHPSPGPPPPPPPPTGAPIIVSATLTPTTLNIGDLLQVSITVTNNSNSTLPTQGPNPGFVYNEGETFRTDGYTEIANQYRVGVDFNGSMANGGIDHPYRWGFGVPLAPGATATVTGAIRMQNQQSRYFWTGLVQEQVAWLQDHMGRALINVNPAPPPPAGNVTITNVTFSPATLNAGDLLNVSITVLNGTNAPLATQGPNPGFVYNEGETFRADGFSEVHGSFRVGVDFDGNATGIDHPYRWGLGTPLAPGQTGVISGAIRLNSAQSRNFWVGLVQEQVAWLQDQVGRSLITVKPPPPPPAGKVTITSVDFSPATLNAGDLLNVSITLLNGTNAPLATQGPNPGFVYNEGETFRADGFSEVRGSFRVGVDFDGNATGIDHPYRWGLGTPLAPGQTGVISGAIRLKFNQSRNFWVGLVQEQVAWLQDQLGVETITVVGGPPSPAAKPFISTVSFTPTTLEKGQLMQVSVSVQNPTGAALLTQGPNPGFIYNEGDNFLTKQNPPTTGAYRIGVDFSGRSGIDHPYRWGLGSSLAPGTSVVVTGYIRLNRKQETNFWVGLIQEQIALLQDGQGNTTITVVKP